MQKAIVSLGVLFFLVAKCNAGGLAPTIVVQPTGTNVLNGDTAVFVAAADSGILALTGVSFTWYCTSNGVTRTVSANSNITISTVITNSLLGIILGGDEAFSVLTIKNANPTNMGKYYVKATELLGGSIDSLNAALNVVTPVVVPVINIATSASALTTSGFNLQMSTPVGSNVVVEASSDMHTWTPIYTNLNSSGTLTYMDTDAKNHTARYYRAHTQ